MSRRRLPSHLQLPIDGLDQDGHGVASYGTRKVRVKAGLPGETVNARVVGRRKGAVLTVAEAVEASSKDRVHPACAFYPRCGGCSAQHLSHARQVEHKQTQLLQELAANQVSYGRLRSPVCGPIVGYRRKARLGVRRLNGDVLVGFRESFGGRIVRMSQCVALAAPFDELLKPLSVMLGSLSIPDAIPQLETAVGDDSAAFVLRHLEPLTAGDVRILGEFEQRHRVSVFTQSGGYDTVRALNSSNAGEFLHYGLVEQGVDFEFSVTDFVQVNAHINAALVRSVLAGLQVGPGDHVLDLFCGLGNFSLPLARKGAHVIGLESSDSSVQRAQHNAKRNGLTALTQFQVADLHAPGTSFDNLTVSPMVTAAVLDPPRSGAGPELNRWLVPTLQRIAYVSCNPVTFARDAAVLTANGFELAEVGVYDMFPNTAHVETLGLFIRVGASTNG